MPQDPIRRFHELVDAARSELARVGDEPRGRSPADSIDEVGAVCAAEGRVRGFLDALVLLRPDLAPDAAAAAQRLSEDVGAMLMTMPGSREPAEPFLPED
jgi:hypothetical protein